MLILILLADESFKQEFLTTHNAHRQKHQSPPLSLSGDLNASAQRWADHLLSIGSMQHSNTDDGENIYFASSSARINLTGRVRVCVSTPMGCCSTRLRSLQGLVSTFCCFFVSGKEAVDSWYSEVKDYNYDRPGFNGNTGNPQAVIQTWLNIAVAHHILKHSLCVCGRCSVIVLMLSC